MESQKTSFSVPTTPQAQREWSEFACGQFAVRGYSRAAEKSFFFVQTLKVALDAGSCYGHAMPSVLLTHGHSDHSRDLGWMMSRENTAVFCPAPIVPYVEAVGRNEIELGSAQPMDPDRQPYAVTGVAAGDSFMLPKIKQRIRCHVYAMKHSVPCVGFGIVPLRKKLKPEYQGLPGAELGRLRRENVALEDEWEAFEQGFLYCGDTGIEAFAEQEESWTRYGSIIIECTFFMPLPGLDDDAIRARCARDGHIYWPDLAPFVERHPNVHFVLIHFSIRYKKADIVDFFTPLQLANVTVVASHYSDQ